MADQTKPMHPIVLATLRRELDPRGIAWPEVSPVVLVDLLADRDHLASRLAEARALVCCSVLMDDPRGEVGDILHVDITAASLSGVAADLGWPDLDVLGTLAGIADRLQE